MKNQVDYKTLTFSGKVLFIADANSTHMLHWARLLKERGAQVTYLSFDEPSEKHVRSVVLRPWLKKHYAKFVVNAPRVARLIRCLKPDIVHSYYLTNYALLAALAKPEKLVVTVAGSDVFLESQKSGLLSRIAEYVILQAHIVHSVANHMTEHLEKLGASRNKIVTFPEGIDSRIFMKCNNQIRDRQPLVVSTRNFKPVYDVETLIKAIPYVTEKLSSVRFVLAGDGDCRMRLRETAERLNVLHYISFPGFLQWKELAAELSRAAVYVSTSKSDGTSASLLQAMYCGAFPVVTNIPANQEWISDSKNGCLYQVSDEKDLAKKIIYSLNNTVLRIEAAKANVESLERRGLDSIMINKLIMTYQSLIG